MTINDVPMGAGNVAGCAFIDRREAAARQRRDANHPVVQADLSLTISMGERARLSSLLISSLMRGIRLSEAHSIARTRR